ncbi:hypothetical protein NL676_017667 [Syzygium grande]|nr:hypothetical protein NL676_017667 [Syzygium grande]
MGTIIDVKKGEIGGGEGHIRKEYADGVAICWVALPLPLRGLAATYFESTKRAFVRAVPRHKVYKREEGGDALLTHYGSRISFRLSLWLDAAPFGSFS